MYHGEKKANRERIHRYGSVSIEFTWTEPSDVYLKMAYIQNKTICKSFLVKRETSKAKELYIKSLAELVTSFFFFLSSLWGHECPHIRYSFGPYPLGRPL